MYCHVRFSQFRESSFAITVYTLLGFSSAVLATFTIFGNLLILYALWKCQTLHAPTKALFCSLALSDLGVGLAAYPLFAAYCLAAVFNDIEVFCAIRGPYTIAGYFLGSVSFITITAITLDRVYAFTLKIRYHQFVTFKRVSFLLFACWIFGFIWPFSFLLDEKISKIVAGMIIFCCVVIASISYIKITVGIRRHQHQIQEQGTISASQQHGTNNFSIEQYKKSLKTMMLVFCLFLACYVPFFAVLPLNLVTGSNSNTNLALNITSAVFKLNSLLNPLVYCWRIREIRSQVMTALSCLAC